jgi:type II secretory pathway component GspD/PulD (secretin)
VLSEESTFNGESMIHLKLKIESLNKNGERELLAKPEILTHENERAEVTVGSVESDKDLVLNVVAKRRL